MKEFQRPEIIFAVLACLLTILGFIFPLRSFPSKKVTHNFFLNIFFSLIIAVEIFFLKKIHFFSENNSDFLNQFSIWFKIGVCIIILDLISYIWHRLNHKLTILWRFHSLHHKIETMDPLAAYRFHPIEVFFGYQLRAASVSFIGFTKVELSIFVLFYGVLNIFQHSNWRLPGSFDKYLTYLFITPQLHHVHHLRDHQLQNSNFGTIFVFWDHLWKTFAKPRPIKINDIGYN